VVGELSRGGREEEERENENAGAGDDDGRRLDPEQSHRAIGDEDCEGIFEEIIVEGTKELGPEKRPESAFGQQMELAQWILRNKLEASILHRFEAQHSNRVTRARETSRPSRPSTI
jgi:ribosome maturation protein Sdo1